MLIIKRVLSTPMMLKTASGASRQKLRVHIMNPRIIQGIREALIVYRIGDGAPRELGVLVFNFSNKML
jgi:hypothetical protein